MSPIVKCSSCKKIMTQKQFLIHTCEPIYKGTKTIPVVEITDLSWKKGMKKLLATGLDGVDYLIEVKKPIAIPFVVTSNSRRKVTPFKTDDKEPVPKYRVSI